jgi:hypothetical protein
MDGLHYYEELFDHGLLYVAEPMEWFIIGDTVVRGWHKKASERGLTSSGCS